MERPFNLLTSFAVLIFFFFFFFFFFFTRAWAQNTAVPIDVGVLLDLRTKPGKTCRTSISMAIDDLYAVHANYSTRVVLHFRDSDNGALGAAAAAVDLLKNIQAKSILGPLTSDEAAFVIQIGNKTQVPVLSFSASSPSLSPVYTPFFVRTTTNDSAQVGAIAAIAQYFGWHQAIPVYEDSNYGTGIVPFLIDALQAVDTRAPYRCVIPSQASTDRLDKELLWLMTMQARVFIVHMLPELATRLFRRAHALGMMSDGYVWITTDGITNFLDQLDEDAVLEAMQGVIGVRSYLKISPQVADFSSRFKQRFRQDHPRDEVGDPSLFELWAYDTTWAVAMAIEKVGSSKMRAAFKKPVSGNNSTDLAQLGVSRSGQVLLKAISHTQFRGLAGKFHVIDGQLQTSGFEIINVVGESGRSIGFWTPKHGISENHKYSVDNIGLKSVKWPGRSTNSVPKGWEIPTNGKKLRIAVPVKHGFYEFVKVETDPATNRKTISGFCIDVFEAAIDALPYTIRFDYFPIENSSQSYDNLVRQVPEGYDAVVGDTTILSKRSQFVDFTLPYTESGVSMIVLLEENKKENMWIFLYPLTKNLWLGSWAFFIFTGLVLGIIEHRDNREFLEGKLVNQLGTIFFFAFSTLVFAHKEKLTSNLSRGVVIIWVFVVLILTSSYTASLTSILTVQQLQPCVTNVNQLQSAGANVGYQEGSFIAKMLVRMGFQEDKLKSYSTADHYAEALMRGSANGGVDAIFDEIPYLKLFISDRCDKFVMVGPTYKADGLGFVFPRGSSLVPDISRAILNITDGEKITKIEEAWFGDTSRCQGKNNDLSSSRLAFRSFGGLFLITAIASAGALLIFSVRFVIWEWDGLINAIVTADNSLRARVAAVLDYYYNHNVDWPNNGHQNQNALVGIVLGARPHPDFVDHQRNDDQNQNAQLGIASPAADADNPAPLANADQDQIAQFGAAPRPVPPPA